MATMAEIEYILGKAILDMDFRSQLMKDPVEAAKSLGLTLTTAQIASIKKNDPEKFDEWANMMFAAGPETGYLW